MSPYSFRRGKSLFCLNHRLSYGRKSQDDGKCQYNLYEQSNCQVSNHGVGALDICLKFQEKSNKQTTVGANGSLSGVQIGTKVFMKALSFGEVVRSGCSD
ncbi:unnamed protein product [Lactuca virosa]|uniref:Uncharacterized protein n=1 Tax=Lactuca virosa TaxID=75947 RepID=A0AAU9P9H7_9ASTR|nr:unnamed protein product [Lactuca virosa]